MACVRGTRATHPGRPAKTGRSRRRRGECKSDGRTEVNGASDSSEGREGSACGAPWGTDAVERESFRSRVGHGGLLLISNFDEVVVRSFSL